MRKGLYIALALCAALCSPTMARADEINYLDSFTNGIETLKGNDVGEVVSPEQDYIDSYEPSEVKLYDTESRALPENATTVDYVNNTVDAFNRNPWNGSSESGMLGFLRNFFLWGGWKSLIIELPIGLVFMWWGVRKAKSIIVGAFRTGRLSFGSVDRNPNSYYYGTRPSDWR